MSVKVGIGHAALVAFDSIQRFTVISHWRSTLSALSLILLTVGGSAALAYGQTDVFVVPNQPWVDSGVSVTVGDSLTITASGEMDWDTDNKCPVGQTCTVGPEGQNPGVPCPVSVACP